MTSDPQSCLPYRRARFTTRLPTDRRYTASHFWLQEESPGVWRVGFTKFATRMLGDVVEHGFQTQNGSAVAVGQVIGWVEGFKAVTDLYCVIDGEFGESNPELTEHPELTDADPYGRGWLYRARGTPDPDALDAGQYAQLLDVQIDRMLDQGQE